MASNSPRHFNSAQLANRRIAATRKNRASKDPDRQEQIENMEAEKTPMFARAPDAINKAANAVFSSSGSTGLFGGGLQASSSFDFTATLPDAGPELSFSPSFQWGNPNARSLSDWEANEERGDHNTRRKKPSQAGLDLTSAPTDSSITAFQPVTQSTLNQGLNYNAAEIPQQSSPFQMIPMSTLTGASSLPTQAQSLTAPVAFTTAFQAFVEANAKRGADAAAAEVDGRNTLFQVASSSTPTPIQPSSSAEPANLFQAAEALTTMTSPGSNTTFGSNEQSTQQSSTVNLFKFPIPPQEQPAVNAFSYGTNHPQTQTPSTAVSFGSFSSPLNGFGHPGIKSGVTETAMLSGQPRSKFTLPPLPALPIGFFRSPSTEVSKLRNISMDDVLGNLGCLSVEPPKWGFEDIDLPDASEEELPTQSWSNNNEMELDLELESDDFDVVLTDAPEIPNTSTFPPPAKFLPTSQPHGIFGTGQQTPSTSTEVFGSISSSNIFGQPQPPTRSESSSFFDTAKEFKENTPPTSNFFGNPRAAQTTEGNVAPASNTFTFLKPANSINSPSSFTFGSPTPPSNAPANPLTNLNQPAPQTVNRSALTNVINSTGLDQNAAVAVPPSPRPASASLKLFSPPNPDVESSSFSSSFSSFTQSITDRASASKPSESTLPSVGPNISDASRSSMSNVFPSMKPVDASSDTNFSNASRSGQSTTSNVFSKPKPSEGATGLNSLVHGNASENFASTEDSSRVFAVMSEVSDSELESLVPRNFNEEQRSQFFAGYRLRALHMGVKAAIAAADLGMNFTPALLSYKIQREQIEDTLETQLKNLKRRRGEDVDEEASGPTKKSKVSDIQTQETLQSLPSNAHIATSQRESKLSLAKSQSLLNGSTTPKAAPPAAGLFQPQTFSAVSPSLTSKRKAEVQITQLNTDGESAGNQSQKIAKLQESSGALESPRSKRKAEVQITQLDPNGEREANQSQKIAKLDGNSGGSETSNIFKNILENPAQLPATTTPRKMFSLTKETDGSDPPPFNAFAALAIPSSSISSTTPASNPALFASAEKPATQSNSFGPMSATSSTDAFSKLASTQSALLSTNMFAKSASTTTAATSNPTEAKIGVASSILFPHSTPSSRSLFGSKPSTAPAISSPLAKAPATADDLPGTPPLTTTSSPFKPVFGSIPNLAPAAGGVKAPTFGAPVNFLAQFGKSAADTENDVMEKAKMEDMDSDEDEEEWEANYKAKRRAERQELDEIAKSAKRFSVTPTTSAASSEKGNSPPPKSQPKSIFAQPAASGIASKSLFPPVNRSGASSPGLISSNGSSIFDSLSSAKPVTFADNIFGHLSDVDSGADSGKGNDADDDTDDSLSDEDEDVDAEENVEPEEIDDEKKDATYDPKAPVSAGPGTPGTPNTPVEETGAGIASAKKSFAFGSPSNSGASTPSLFDRINKDVDGNPIRQIPTDDKENPNSGTSTPSLFDRITKDASGNPIRQMPTDDKENPSPALTSIFTKSTSTSAPVVFNFSRSTLTDTTKAASDNTWKPDTPIKFGQSTSTPIFNFGSGPSTPPAVKVQAPTPTKGSPFTGFFESTNPPPPTTPTLGAGGASLFTGLFGSTSTAQPTSSIFSNISTAENKPLAVGFNFGGPSTSSLFPSVAGSDVTSRATTPGVTTDGESTNEGVDHEEIGTDEQINLGSGGAGEEDEEVMFEVRTKAFRYELPTVAGEGKSHEKAWIIKGLGNIRILKHKETGLTRMLMRADPSGNVILNKRILPHTEQASQKTIKITTSDDSGKGVESWLLQVKTPELATELADTLEKYKSPCNT